MISRFTSALFAPCILVAAVALYSPAAAQAPSSASSDWVMPRTPDGRPNLQGNWTNLTVTPIQRPEGVGPVLTSDEVAAIEGQRDGLVEAGSAASDPDRSPPPAGGTNPICIDSGTSCYNYVYWDQGDRVAIFNGEPRSSLVTNPANGRIPPLTPEAQQRSAELTEFNSRFGEYDNPENRPLAERCLMSYGSNAGPPMLPNYGYNNNYTIVQTPDHIMILTEMVHDVRIIRLGERVVGQFESNEIRGQQFLNLPNPIRQTGSLGRGRFDPTRLLGQRRVCLAEIIVHEVKRHGILVELDRLAEGIR